MLSYWERMLFSFLAISQFLVDFQSNSSRSRQDWPAFAVVGIFGIFVNLVAENSDFSHRCVVHSFVTFDFCLFFGGFQPLSLRFRYLAYPEWRSLARGLFFGIAVHPGITRP